MSPSLPDLLHALRKPSKNYKKNQNAAFREQKRGPREGSPQTGQTGRGASGRAPACGVGGGQTKNRGRPRAAATASLPPGYHRTAATPGGLPVPSPPRPALTPLRSAPVQTPGPARRRRGAEGKPGAVEELGAEPNFGVQPSPPPPIQPRCCGGPAPVRAALPPEGPPGSPHLPRARWARCLAALKNP